MTKKTRNWLIALFILAFPFVLIFGFLVFMDGSLPPVAPLPNPNGYEDFIKAGKILTAKEDDYYQTNEANERRVVAENAQGLSLAREGLFKECRVTVQFNSAYANNHIPDLVAVKKLAITFASEGKVAEMENRPNDAVRSYLDAIHLGNESARGGILIDQLVGTAIEAVGTSCLQKIVNQLDAKTCRETTTALEVLDTQRQTWNDVIQQENAWSRRTFMGLRYRLLLLYSGRSLKQDQEKAQQHFINQQAKTRQLILALAARAYELDKGHPPANAADLVPEYLKAVPQDPVTGTNMVYPP
jgi:hypothetical protein